MDVLVFVCSRANLELRVLDITAPQVVRAVFSMSGKLLSSESFYRRAAFPY